MIVTDRDDRLLYIEPKSFLVEAPVNDEWTRGMQALFAQSRRVSATYRGFHTCACGERSTNTDYLIGPDRVQTNSLCVHYLRAHRSEVPRSELEKLRVLMRTYSLPLPAEDSPAALHPEPRDPWEYIPNGTYNVRVFGSEHRVHIVRAAVPEVIVEFPGGPGTITRPDLVEQMAKLIESSDDPRIGAARHERTCVHTLIEITELLDSAGISQEGDVVNRLRRALKLEES